MKITNPTLDDLNQRMNSIARLLLSSVRRSLQPGKLITASQIIAELFNLELMKPNYREKACHAIISIARENELMFDVDALLYLLQSKKSDVAHKEILLADIIGKGSYGEVQLGAIYNKHVAIKWDDGREPGEMAMRLEADIHRRLKDVHIIPFVCTLERGNRFGIVMEYAGNGTLDSFINEYDYDVIDECMYSFAKQINAGLGYIHSQGYVHLDVKPANILLGFAMPVMNANLMLADFGTTDKQGKIKPFDVTTYFYCAPERFDVNSPYQYANDIYSYAVVLGQMDTKESPWLPSATRESIRAAINSGDRPAFNGRKITPRLAALIKQCWRHEPKERLTSPEIDEYLERHFKPK